MKRFRPNLFITLCSIVLLIGCYNQEVQPKKEKIPFIETIRVQSDPKLLEILGDLYNKKSKPIGRTLDTDFGNIILEEAIKIERYSI